MRKVRILVGVSLAVVLVASQTTAQESKRRPELEAAYQKGVALWKSGNTGEGIPLLEKAAALAPEVFGADHLHTAGICNTLGALYRDGGRQRDAETYFRRALVIREARLGKDHLDVAASLGNVAFMAWRMGRYKEAEALYQRCLQIRESKLAAGDHLVTDVLNNVAMIYQATARYRQAEQTFRRCLELREARLGKDHVDVANIQGALAELYLVMGRHNEAEVLARRALEVREARMGKDHPWVAASLNTLGNLCRETGRYGEAETFCRRSLAIRETKLGKDHLDVAVALNNLGLCCSALGRGSEAEALYLRSLQIREVRQGPHHPGLAPTLANLGVLYQVLGRAAEAESLLRRSLQVREAALGADHPDVASSLNNLAGLYAASGRVQEAVAAFKRALHIAEVRLGKDHPDVATYLNGLALLYNKAGRYQEAEEFYLRSLRINEARWGNDHPLVATVLHNLGTMYWSMGRLADAEKFLRRGFEIAEGKVGKDHPSLAFYLGKLAGLSMALGRPQAALELQDRALRLGQANLRDVFAFSSEQAMYAYLKTVSGLLPITVSMAAASESSEGAVLGLTWALRRKGVVLDTLCRYRQLQQRLTADDALAQSLAQYRGLKQRLANAALSPPQGLTPEQVKEQLSLWQKEAQELEAGLNRALAEKQNDRSGDWAQVSAAAVQKNLPPGSALVEFVRAQIRDFKGNRWRKTHYFAFVLTPGEAAPRLIDLGEAKVIDAGVEAVRKEFTDFQEKLRECESPEEVRDLEKTQEKHFLKVSAALYERLFAPLEGALGKAQLLYLALDGDLNRLPFESLVDAEGKYLLESYRCAYLSSGRDLLRSAPPAAKGTVVFAGPDYKLGAPERLARAEQLLGKKEQVAARGLVGQEVRSVGWRPLPGASAEAGDIQKALAGGAYGPVKAYVGANALEEVLKALPAPRVLHLATHGFALDRAQEKEVLEPDAEGTGAGWARGRLKQMDNPLLRSGIVLAGANAVGAKDAPAQAEDGWVTAEEIALLDLRGCELVVLSACQTGLGDVRSGEGVYGLRRGFLYAGARTLVTSLFEVPDQETRTLMARFYGGLAAGRNRLEALHGAQRELLRQRRQEQGAAHPFFWASFVLVGDPG